MLNDERQRVAEYLHSNTEEKLIKCVVKNLLANPKQQQLLENEESGLCVQLKQDKLKNVASMFRCIKLVEDYKLDGGLQVWPGPAMPDLARVARGRQFSFLQTLQFLLQTLAFL